MIPFVDDTDFTLYVGDALETLRDMPDESVHCCVTSPPYWGLRDYSCDGQLGLEPTPEEYVANMVAVFREVRRVLRRDGTCWLNIGDSYAGSGKGPSNDSPLDRPYRGMSNTAAAPNRWVSVPQGVKQKDLVGIPWRLAFALQADGWYLRSEITWCKRNCMPESVTDRPTSATEKLFLLTRSPRYFYDQDAVREPHQYDGRKKLTHDHEVNGSHENYANMGTDQERWPNSGRNLRNWWPIATEPFTGWESVVRQRPVAADAPDGGKKRTTSPDCPVHGDRPVPVPTVADGGRGDGSSTRTERTDAGHARAQLAEHAPTGPRLEPGSALGSSDSPDLADFRTATAHNTGSHKTASRSTSGGTAGAETSCRTGDTSPSSASLAQDGSDSRDSSGTPDHTDCTCTWYVEYTDKTSHFATFPQALVEPCILAGTSERGCCPVCGAPWEREIVATGADNGRVREDVGDWIKHKGGNADGKRSLSGATYKPQRAATDEWRPTCTCAGALGAESGQNNGSAVPRSLGSAGAATTERLKPIPCTVLDPFMGSGTTAVVARRLGRRSIGIELSAEYAQLAARRLQQLSLLAAS